MTKDPTKKQSAAVVADPSLEEKIRLRAYQAVAELFMFVTCDEAYGNGKMIRGADQQRQ
jgi:hypothetical protein